MKNKLNLKTFLLIIFFPLQISISQEISPEQIQMLNNFLANGDESQVLFAVEKIQQNNLVEFVPQLTTNFWKYRPFTEFKILFTLQSLHYSGIYPLTLSYLDSLDHYDYSDSVISSQELKSLTNMILFELNDYTKKENTFNYVDEISPVLSKTEIYLLEKILMNVPSDSARVKEDLIKAASESPDELIRYIAISILHDHYGIQILPFAITRFKEETDYITRDLILTEILAHYHNTDVHNLLREQSVIDTNAQVKSGIIEQLLNNYGTISDYKLAIYTKEQLTDEIFRPYLNVFLEYYKPIKPDSSISILTLKDTLTSYIDQCYAYSWLRDNNYLNDLSNKIISAKNYLMQSDSIDCAKEIKSFQTSIRQVYSDSAGSYPKYVSSDGYKFLYYYSQYILDRLPSVPTGLPVKLVSSTGTNLTGSSLQYYDGTWKDAVNNNDGTFSVDTKLTKVSLRMTYEYGSQTLSNVAVGRDTIIFRTVNTQIKIQNSSGVAIDTGKVQYYAGAWRDFGTTTNGVATKELLPNNYSFRMTYAYASNDKQQNIGTDPNVIFQTVNANVQLKNSLGNLIDQGTVQYYAGAWRDFGTTTNGVATKELLPNNYSFRMTYEFVSKDIAQNIGTNSVVSFSTVLCTVRVKDIQGQSLSDADTKYYSGAWREIGMTSANGEVSKELLPANLTFRVNYGTLHQDKTQNLSANNIVDFTVTTGQ